MTTGKLTGISAPGGLGLSYSFDSSLLTGVTWSGAVAGSTAYTYNNDLRVTAESINAANSVSYGYDVDGLLKTAGSLALIHNAQNGLRTGSTLGSVSDSLSYNTHTELTNYSASYASSGIYSAAYTHDALGRITQKVETIGGTATTYGYTYDAAGRLSAATKNGSPFSTYSYDSNGNRTARTGPSVIASYDAQDRLTNYGSTTYSYTANGELQSKTNGTQTTGYHYDALGNLLKVTLPNGTVIDYLIDGNSRRIGKKVNGTLVQGFLYQGSLRPIAELDGSNAVVSRFVYATHINVPDYMVKGGVTYRLITDQLGSPRLVVNVATGTVAQRIDYDEFGQVLSDSNPGFQPFGFAGGLYDRDIKLVRFGARDYDAETGRWSAKDPIGFGGGDGNLYRYIGANPVSSVDPTGLCVEPLCSIAFRQAGLDQWADSRNSSISIEGIQNTTNAFEVINHYIPAPQALSQAMSGIAVASSTYKFSSDPTLSNYYALGESLFGIYNKPYALCAAARDLALTIVINAIYDAPTVSMQQRIDMYQDYLNRPTQYMMGD